jgi:membrane-associated phospholipid phosphatase
VASFTVVLLGRVSHQLNTFPSGHVAVATAVALAIFPVSRLAGVIFGVIAAGIAAGAAAGRYHYGIDVVVGAVVGIVAALAAV